MNQKTERLDSTSKVLVVAAKKPLFPGMISNAVAISDRLMRNEFLPPHQYSALPVHFTTDREDVKS